VPDRRIALDSSNPGGEVPRGTVPGATSHQIPGTPSAARESQQPASAGLQDVSVDQIRPNARQPRQDFDPSAIDSLAESIRVAGIMQPIVVRPSVDGTFEIIAGERRWRAARQLGLLTVPAVVRDVDDRTAAEWALIENIQRADLNPIERAAGLRRLIDDFGLTHQELGERVGLDRASVSNLLRLHDLDPFSRDAVRTGRLSQGHAKALLAISRLDLRQTLAAAAMSGEWSVRELERRVRQATEATSSPSVSPDALPIRSSAHLADLERRLSEHLGSRVTIQLGRKRGSGRILIDFFTLDQFDGILSRLGFQEG
jgi:ParB family chromosome partitioning protein